MRFKGEIIIDNAGEVSSETDFVMVESQPERKESGHGRPATETTPPRGPGRVRRIINLFKPGKERHLKPPVDPAFVPMAAGNIDASKFQVINAPETKDPWKLFKD